MCVWDVYVCVCMMWECMGVCAWGVCMGCMYGMCVHMYGVYVCVGN